MLLRVIKPFGVEELTKVEEAFRSMMVPDGELYKVEIGNQIFEINSGKYGTTREQRENLAVFMSDERKDSYIISGQAFHSIIISTKLKSKKKKILFENIGRAMLAFNKLIMATQTYNLERISSRDEFEITSQIISPTTDHLYDFGSTLLYEIIDGGRIEIGDITSPKLHVFVGFTKNDVQKIQSILDENITAKEFLVKAYSSFAEEEYGFAVVYAALCCENVMKLFIRSELEKKGNIPNAKLDDFLRTSNNILSEVVLGYISNIPSGLLVEASKLFNARNKFAHGKGETLGKGEVLKHITTAEEIGKLLKWAQ